MKTNNTTQMKRFRTIVGRVFFGAGLLGCFCFVESLDIAGLLSSAMAMLLGLITSKDINL